MKKIAVVVAAFILVVSVVSVAFAAEMKGTVKSVDAKTGTVVLAADGKDVTLKADKSVNLSTVKAGEKVEASVEKDVLKSIKAQAAPRPMVGC